MGLLLGQVSKWRAQRADRGAHAARGFVGGVAQKRLQVSPEGLCFNAARGFVGGAAPFTSLLSVTIIRFNAARGFVGGATLSLAPP